MVEHKHKRNEPKRISTYQSKHDRNNQETLEIKGSFDSLIYYLKISSKQIAQLVSCWAAYLLKKDN